MKTIDIKKVAVIGTGTMGPGIAQVFAQHEITVQIFDIDPEQLKKARETLASVMRVVKKDMAGAIDSSPLARIYEDEFSSLQDIQKTQVMPTLEEMKVLADLAFREISLASVPLVKEGTFVGRSGKNMEGQILTMGRFLNAYISDGETGYLHDPHDIRGMAQSILMLKRNTSHYNEMSQNARKWAEDTFSIDSMVQQYEGIFNKVEGRGGVGNHTAV